MKIPNMDECGPNEGTNTAGRRPKHGVVIELEKEQQNVIG